MGWNHRIVTWMAPHPVPGMPATRLFGIIEVYYKADNDLYPQSYIDAKNNLSNLESVEELKWTVEHVLLAFNKPILDLDHWPQVYKEEVPG